MREADAKYEQRAEIVHFPTVWKCIFFGVPFSSDFDQQILFFPFSSLIRSSGLDFLLFSSVSWPLFAAWVRFAIASASTNTSVRYVLSITSRIFVMFGIKRRVPRPNAGRLIALLLNVSGAENLKTETTGKVQIMWSGFNIGASKTLVTEPKPSLVNGVHR
jgi:hypothetical protein